MASHPKSKEAKHISPYMPLQDGRATLYPLRGYSGSLHEQGRLEGRLSHSIRTPRLPELSSVYVEKHHLSIQNHAFWSEHSPFRFHENPQTANCSFTGTCHSTYSVYRRYTDISGHATSFTPRYTPNHFLTSTARVQDKPGEIAPYPQSENRFPRARNRPSNNDPKPPSEITDKHNISEPILNTQKTVLCAATGRIDRHTNILQNGNTPSPTLLSLPPTGPITNHTNAQQFRCDSNTEPKLPLRPKVVGKECESPQLLTNSQTRNQRDHANRRLTNRLGVVSGNLQASGQWSQNEKGLHIWLPTLLSCIPGGSFREGGGWIRYS